MKTTKNLVLGQFLAGSTQKLDPDVFEWSSWMGEKKYTTEFVLFSNPMEVKFEEIPGAHQEFIEKASKKLDEQIATSIVATEKLREAKRRLLALTHQPEEEPSAPTPAPTFGGGSSDDE